METKLTVEDLIDIANGFSLEEIRIITKAFREMENKGVRFHKKPKYDPYENKLEKAFDRACEELANYRVKCLADDNYQCPDIRCRDCDQSLHTKDQWKEWLLKDENTLQNL